MDGKIAPPRRGDMIGGASFRGTEDGLAFAANGVRYPITKRANAGGGWYRAPGWRAAARRTKTYPNGHSL